MEQSENDIPKAPDQAAAADERRIAVRKRVRTRVRLSIAGSTAMEVWSLDLSIGGICVVADVNPATGTKCSLALGIPFKNGTSHKTQVQGSISYSSFSNADGGFKVGVQFKDVTPELHKALLRFVSS